MLNRTHAELKTTICRGAAGLLVALLVVLGGCASGGHAGWGGHSGSGGRSGSGQVGADGVGGLYAGSLVVDGRPFGASLNLRRSGGHRFEGAFSTSSPVSIEGVVDGAVVDRLLRIVVEYRTPDGCDGRIQGILDVGRDGHALEGPVTVSDCQEPVAAELVLVRRDGR